MRHTAPRVPSRQTEEVRAGRRVRPGVARNTGLHGRPRTSCGNGGSWRWPQLSHVAGLCSAPLRASYVSTENREARRNGKRGAASTSNCWKGPRLPPQVRNHFSRNNLLLTESSGAYITSLLLISRKSPRTMNCQTVPSFNREDRVLQEDAQGNEHTSLWSTMCPGGEGRRLFLHRRGGLRPGAADSRSTAARKAVGHMPKRSHRPTPMNRVLKLTVVRLGLPAGSVVRTCDSRSRGRESELHDGCSHHLTMKSLQNNYTWEGGHLTENVQNKPGGSATGQPITCHR